MPNRLTVKMAAVHAGVSESLVRSWIAALQLPHYRLGAKGKRGKILIEVADLDALTESLKVEGAGPKPALKPALLTLKYLHLPS